MKIVAALGLALIAVFLFGFPPVMPLMAGVAVLCLVILFRRTKPAKKAPLLD